MNKTMDVSGYSISELKRKVSELDADILDKTFVLVTKYFHQYAWGITGATRNMKVYVNTDGHTFPYVAAAYKAFKDMGFKVINRSGENTEYGEIGAEMFTREVVTLREVLSWGNWCEGYSVPFNFNKAIIRR